MNHLSLFSGIGGLDLAAEWAGFVTVGFVERDKFCQRVLAKHWPGVPIWDDVADVGHASFSDGRRTVAGSDHQGIGQKAVGSASDVGIISGGFPCQPHSLAGKRQASADERDLWGECARIVGEFRPRWCVFENVPGLLSSEGGSFFARVLGDLAALGYGVGWATYGAVDVGAPHRRDRVFIVAHARREGRERGGVGSGDTEDESVFDLRATDGGGNEAMDDAGSAGCEERDPAAVADGSGHGAWRSDASGRCWEFEPPVGRVANGIPPELDGALNAEEHDSQGCSTGNEDGSNVSGVRRNGEGRAAPSELCGAESLSDLVRSLSCQGRSAGRYAPNETDAALRDLRDGVSAVTHQEECDVQQAMPVRTGAAERHEALGWEVEPAIPRVAVGIKDRVNRLRALGNAVVPQQAYPIFRTIAEIEGIYRG
jgi:DNA (cytosine-5)-methyltransferase 1